MRERPWIDRVRLVLASRADGERGLIGFIRAGYGQLELDGIALRRTRRGEPAPSWPCRRDRWGRGHAVVRPRSGDARRELDRQILEALGLGDGSAS